MKTAAEATTITFPRNHFSGSKEALEYRRRRCRQSFGRPWRPHRRIAISKTVSHRCCYRLHPLSHDIAILKTASRRCCYRLRQLNGDIAIQQRRRSRFMRNPICRHLGADQTGIWGYSEMTSGKGGTNFVTLYMKEPVKQSF